MEVLDEYADGRPHHVKATIKILGLVDKEILEYHWGPDWMVWDANATFQQRGQHVEYNLKREGLDQTRVRFDITVEPSGPIPAFIVRRASKLVLQTATQGLRERIMAAAGTDQQQVIGPSRSAPSRRIASSRVSSRLAKVNRTR